MRVVDLGDHHRDVGRPAVGGVVRDHGDLGAGVAFLKRFDLLFFHIDGAENEVDKRADRFDILRRQDGHIRDRVRHRGLHLPALAHRLAIGLSRGTGAGDHSRQFKIGMIFEQGGEPLTDHAGRADDARFEFLHIRALLQRENIISYYSRRRAVCQSFCGRFSLYLRMIVTFCGRIPVCS